MKKQAKIAVLVGALVLITTAIAAVHLTTRTAVPEGTLRVIHGEETRDLSWKDLDWEEVQGTLRNGKGEERTVESQGVALADVLSAAGISSYGEVSVTAEDEYSASFAAEEIPGEVYLIQQEEGGLQLAVFTDSNSKRNVSNVAYITVS